ncbi:hypothetical protein D5R40_20425 [Okeania hirsuta]|uniref:Uncharacterized protein n=1 Tax=Okeania hirsuta TaxID=1458930 RepID=A0A3N6NZH1_9CYAN|nr:hypothetical protein D4Z78_15420 [Okeania hirsuta]RQH34804.1 hypothetical protein D5R40_20425 [Okeania hirsuta]
MRRRKKEEGRRKKEERLKLEKVEGIVFDKPLRVYKPQPIVKIASDDGLLNPKKKDKFIKYLWKKTKS